MAKHGLNPRRVDEIPEHVFQFTPTWSQDGKQVSFLAGQHCKRHRNLVRADGTGLRKLADRGMNTSATQPLKFPDFHFGSSD